MKKLFLLISIVTGLSLLQSCSQNSPEAVAKKAIAAVQKGDYDSYASTFNLSPSDQKEWAGLAEEKISEDMSEKGGIKEYEITESKVNDDKATVTVHITYEDGSENDEVMNFSKVDGKWLQELDK